MHCTVGGHLGCFQFGAVMNNAAANVVVHGFWWTNAYISIGIYLEAELLDMGMFRFDRYCPYLFPIADVINYHTYDVLIQQKCILCSSGVQKSKIFTRPESRCQQTHTPSRGSREEFAFWLFQLLVAASIPWLVATSLQSLPLWSHCLLFCLCHILLDLPHIKTHVMAFRDHPNNQDNLLVSKSLL